MLYVHQYTNSGAQKIEFTIREQRIVRVTNKIMHHNGIQMIESISIYLNITMKIFCVSIYGCFIHKFYFCCYKMLWKYYRDANARTPIYIVNWTNKHFVVNIISFKLFYLNFLMCKLLLLTRIKIDQKFLSHKINEIWWLIFQKKLIKLLGN